MAKSNKVLSIDITNESITIIELTASKKQTNIHDVIIFETPEDSYEDGLIKEPEKIANAIREQLTSRGISNKNVIFVLSSTKIVNREVIIPYVKENKIRGIINSNSSEYFPVNIEDYVVSHSVLEEVTDEDGNKQLRVLAVAAPSQMVRSFYDLGALAGLNVTALDYIGNAMLQLIKTQTNEATTSMVVQLGSESTVLNIVQGDNLLLQRTVPYGTNSVVNVVMDEKGVDATTAMTLLQNDKLITVDFDDNEATGAFRYLINNIGRVMDYYATKNPDKPIEDILLTGDGALVKGIDGLFKIQLNVNTRIMDTLYNIKFDPSIDLKVYNPVYLVTPIGAALDPMGFVPMEASSRAARSSEGGSLIPAVAVTVACALGAAGLLFYSINEKNKQKDAKVELEAKIAQIKDIEDIVAVNEAAKNRMLDAKSMDDATYHLNENMYDFIMNLEDKMPKDVAVESFKSDDDQVVMPCVSLSYDSIAEFVMQLKSMDCIENAFVTGIAKVESDETDVVGWKFNVTAVYVNRSIVLDEEGTSADAVEAEASTEAAE